MIDFIKKMINDKKEYKEQLSRVEKLPEDYRFVFEKIQGYIWSFGGGDGSDMLKIQQELIELFEMSSANGKHILEVTGEDVAGFCDDFIRDTKKWTDKYGDKLNSNINDKLKRK